eukprot:262653-Pyramimonas_sp.AAC.1
MPNNWRHQSTRTHNSIYMSRRSDALIPTPPPNIRGRCAHGDIPVSTPSAHTECHPHSAQQHFDFYQ